MIIRTSIFLIWSILLSACTTSNHPTPSDHMNVTIYTDKLSELRWYVPASEVIQLTISNQTPERHTWSILTPTATRKMGEPWFTAQILPGETLNLRFTSPDAPGEYDIISQGEWANNPLTGEIVVIQINDK